MQSTQEKKISMENSKVSGGSTYNILVVDNEPNIRDLLTRYFESEFYAVDVAENGVEAWQKIQNKKYDCTFIDLKMPGMSGQDLFQLIQGIGGRPPSKVIFITGDTMSPDTLDFIARTGNPVITKPFGLDELLQSVHDP